MSRFRSAVPQHGGRVDLPGVVEELLVEVVADGFVVYCCGPKSAPNALVAAYEWDHYACVDLLTVRDFDRVITARVPKRGTVDVFAPEVVVWAYEGPPQPALRALLALVHPAHPEAPTVEYPAPAGLRVPRARQRPMTIRLPSPGRVGVRAARLAAAVPTPSADRTGGDAAPGGTSRPRDRRLVVGGACGPRRGAPGGQPIISHPQADVDDTPIPLFAQVELIAEDTEPTMLPSRLHQHGQVVGRGTDCL